MGLEKLNETNVSEKEVSQKDVSFNPNERIKVDNTKVETTDKLETSTSTFNPDQRSTEKIKSNADDNVKEESKLVEGRTETDNSETKQQNETGQVEKIHTFNESLEGKRHEKTGVLFVREIVKLSSGRIIEGVFPKFDSFKNMRLPKNLYKESFDKQKKYLNEKLKELVDPDSKRYDEKLVNKLTKEQIEDIKDGLMPEGLVWHHNQKEGLMQLVDATVHDKTEHTGGMSIWGKGHD